MLSLPVTPAAMKNLVTKNMRKEVENMEVMADTRATALHMATIGLLPNLKLKNYLFILVSGNSVYPKNEIPSSNTKRLNYKPGLPFFSKYVYQRFLISLEGLV